MASGVRDLGPNFNSGVPWASGNTAQMNSVSGFSGQLFFNTTYNAWFQWITDRWRPFGPPDPRYGFYTFDDFMGADRIQSIDLANGAAPAAGNLLNPGVINITQSTGTAANYAALQGNTVQFGTMDLFWEALVSIPTLATASDDGCLSAGYSDKFTFDANGACTDGVWFTLNRSVNAAKWIINTSSNGTATNINTNSTVTAGTWYRIGIAVSGSTSAVFSVNGAPQGTISTNLPTGAGRQTGLTFKTDKTASTGAALTLSIDYSEAYGFFNGQRVA